MDYKCTVELKGDIFDSLRLTSVLDEIIDSGSVCKIKELKVGEARSEDSYARIKIRSENKKTLDDLIESLKKYGVTPVKIISRTVEIQGHIVDSLTLSKILDIIFNNNARCEIQDIKIGLEKKDFSYAKIKISTTNQQIMDNLLEKIIKQGAVLVEQ
jgi:hypothetical protein